MSTVVICCGYCSEFLIPLQPPSATKIQIGMSHDLCRRSWRPHVGGRPFWGSITPRIIRIAERMAENDVGIYSVRDKSLDWLTMWPSRGLYVQKLSTKSGKQFIVTEREDGGVYHIVLVPLGVYALWDILREADQAFRCLFCQNSQFVFLV